MIYEKSLKLPDFKRRTIRRKLSLFSEQEGALYCRGIHFKRGNGGLVMAEGAELVSALPEGCMKLVCSSGHSERIFVFCAVGLLSLDDGKRYPVADLPKFIVIYRTEENGELLFVMTAGGLSLMKNGSWMSVAWAPKGDCGCVAFERLITASGDKVSWSNPLNPDNWRRSLQGAGFIELPSREGEILEMFPIKESVYLFRERGITRLILKGDPLTFVAENIPCPFGKIVRNSVQLCGDKAMFLTESGVYTFDGTKAKRLSDCGFSEVDFDKEIFSAAFHGKYCAAVSLKNGDESLWLIDPTENEGHFLRMRAELLVGGDSLLFADGGKLFRLTERGLSPDGRCATLSSEHSLLGLSGREKYLDGVTIEGSGYFSVEARTERGNVKCVSGAAGERLAFPAPLRGVGFSLQIRTICENAAVRSVTFDIREESAN